MTNTQEAQRSTHEGQGATMLRQGPGRTDGRATTTTGQDTKTRPLAAEAVAPPRGILDRKYSRLAFDEPVGPNPVTVYDSEGRISRVITTEALNKRKLSYTRPPEITRRTSVIPSVPIRVRRTKTERD